MDYFKQNHLLLLLITYLVISSFFEGTGVLGALDRTTVGNPWTFASTLNVTGVPTFTADAVFNGGASGITVTTSNTATSSIIVGCVNTYATSTATAIKMFPGAINTSASTTYTGGTVGGFVVWAYGNCP